LSKIDFSPQRHRGHRETIFDLAGRYPPNQKLSMNLRKKANYVSEQFWALVIRLP
jgi:hypothetical protein